MEVRICFNSTPTKEGCFDHGMLLKSLVAAGEVEKKKEKSWIFIKKKNLMLDQADILDIESKARKVQIHTAMSKEIIEIYAAMEKLEGQLGNQ